VCFVIHTELALHGYNIFTGDRNDRCDRNACCRFPLMTVDVNCGGRVWPSARIVPTGVGVASVVIAPQAELKKIRVNAPTMI
jgi:hypothetical protein